jgi:methylmalonyl-CoA mutase cobalamin-binding subunit
MKSGNIAFYNTVMKVCIDQANGHMQELLSVCRKFKDEFGDKVLIMTGNVANPETYREYAKAGIDYIRLGIGTGNICTTSVQTGVHYPMASLIIDTYRVKKDIIDRGGDDEWGYKLPKIIADGGFKSISQIIKALALGADYVMLGEIIAKSDEACEPLNDVYVREYYGMSTEKAQFMINESSAFKKENFEPKHTEGIHKFIQVEYPINEWLKDFTHALRSSMSYLNIRDISLLMGNVDWEVMSINSYNAYNNGK